MNIYDKMSLVFEKFDELSILDSNEKYYYEDIELLKESKLDIWGKLFD